MGFWKEVSIELEQYCGDDLKELSKNIQAVYEFYFSDGSIKKYADLPEKTRQAIEAVEARRLLCKEDLR